MKIIKEYKAQIIILLIFMGLFFYDPIAAKNSSVIVYDFVKEMVKILPPIFMLMGLIEVWISKENIQKWIGKNSGIRGMAVSIGLGTLPTGPLYAAFPMASSLLGKGASISNIVFFLGSWAALKIPHLMMEIEFLGLSFTALRFTLTLVFLIPLGFFIEFALNRMKPDIELLNSLKEETHMSIKEPKVE